MNQVLHILKKDVRYLRNEIGLLSVLSLLYARTAAHAFAAADAADERFIQVIRDADYYAVALLLVVTSVILIALVVQAEAIPGDKQFWITRPYRWADLLASKLLFILLFVNLPVFIGRLLVVLIVGPPLMPSIPGLVSSQVWLLLVIALPTAVVAAVTAGLVPFIFTMGALFIVSTSAGSLSQAITHWPQALQWVRDAASILALLMLSALTLYLTYKGRRFTAGRVLGVGSVGALLLFYRFLPLSFATDLQTKISPQPSAASSIQVSSTAPTFWTMRFRTELLNAFDGRLMVTGVPDGLEAESDAMSISLRAPDGRTWDSGVVGLGGFPLRGARNRWAVNLDEAFINAEHDQPLTLSASVYLTVLGNRSSKLVSPEKPFADITNDLQCRILWQQVVCRSVSALSGSMVFEDAPNEHCCEPAAEEAVHPRRISGDRS